MNGSTVIENQIEKLEKLQEELPNTLDGIEVKVKISEEIRLLVETLKETP